MKRVFACGLALACALGFASPARAQVVSPLDFNAASLGDVRLGVALAVMSELVDAPALLVRPSSQSFVDDAFARILASTNDAVVRARSTAYRDDLRTQDGATLDRARADADLTALTRDVLHALPAPRDRLCVVGILAESIAYNARVLRSPTVDADLRKTLGAASIADTLFPGLAEMRSDLAVLHRGRWSEIASVATKIVTAIAGNSSEAPFPANHGVWLVLLRSASVDGMTARRGTPHLWLDIVRFDGTHRAVGAHPEGGDFARDARRLTCAFDREGNDESERAIPLVPPAGTTDAQLADAFTARCTAEAKSQIPYRVRDASDARFIVDAMLSAGIDAAAVMREATGRAR